MKSRCWMTVLAAGASAASVGLAQPMPPRRPPMERVESSKQPPTHTPEAKSEKTPEPEAVKRLRVRDKVIEFPDGPVLDCRFADRLGQWTSDLVIPVVFGGLGT